MTDGMLPDWLWLLLTIALCVPIPFLQAAERRARRRDEARCEELMRQTRTWVKGSEMSSETVIRAVAFKEGDAWVVQGIEYDIAAHAWEPADLPAAFMRAVIDNVVITENLGRKALEGIKPAPDRFRRMFDHAKAQVMAIDDVMPGRLPVKSVDIRLAAANAT